MKVMIVIFSALLLMAPPAVSQVSDDKLIVPGVRIGKWTLAVASGSGTVAALLGTGIVGFALTKAAIQPPVHMIFVSPSTSVVPLDREQVFTAWGRDAAGNRVSINPTWTVAGGIGTVSPTVGTRVTFTAVSLGRGSVQAVDQGITGSATVTVREVRARARPGQ